MESEDRILATEFCTHHNIGLPFIQVLSDNGMIVTEIVEDSLYIPASELRLVEKIIHFHFDLEINLEGIETIIHLLGRLETMQNQITHLTNRLKAYES